MALRTNPERARYLNPISPDIDRQRSWIEAYLERGGDWYFAVARNVDGQTEGFVGIYDLDEVARRAEWGRWILRAGSLAAIESARLVYEVAFDALNLQEVYCRTVAENAQVVSFHDACGLVRAAVHEKAFRPPWAPEGLDMVEHRLDRARWPEVRDELARKSSVVAAMLKKRVR